MHVLAEGRWLSPAGRIVTDGIGWKPSSDAGSAGEPARGSIGLLLSLFSEMNVYYSRSHFQRILSPMILPLSH